MKLIHSFSVNKGAQRLAKNVLVTACGLCLPVSLLGQDAATEQQDLVVVEVIGAEDTSTCSEVIDDASVTDKTVTLGDKRVTITDENGQVSVKVFKTDEAKGKTQELRPVYEGTFSDERSMERYTVAEDLGFAFPLNFHKRGKKRIEMQPHWGGFGMGLSNIATHAFDAATFEGYRLNNDRSFEWILNLNEFMVPLPGNCFGLTMGFGLAWRNYYMDGNVYMASDGQRIQMLEETDLSYKSARLRSLHLTTPLFLEWQPTLGGKKDFFVTAGVVGGYKAFANYKVAYKDRNKTIKHKTARGKDMHMPPLVLDYMVQIGMKDVSIYGKYSPFGMFKSDQGPDVHTVSVGVILHVDD